MDHVAKHPPREIRGKGGGVKTVDAARGQWQRIIPSIGGIDAKYLDGKHHPCPCTGEGTDRFRFSNQNGSGDYFCACSSGGKGGMALLECITGRTFRELAPEVDTMIGNTHTATAVRRVATYAEQLRARAIPSTRSAYLQSRGLIVAPGLRFARDVEYRDDGAPLGKFDAMLAPITRRGEWLTYHVTYLRDGRKANVPCPRKILPGGAISGAGVELYPAAEEMGVGEGIETCIAAATLHAMPVHSALNADMLGKWEAPDVVRKLHIFADHDANFAGHRGAYTQAHRAAMRGIEVCVHFPDVVGTDWNDVLIAKIAQGAAA
jgi:putative DNA primase/helicase